MTHRLTTNYAKNYCNQTFIVKVIVENVVTCFFWDMVYMLARLQSHSVAADLLSDLLSAPISNKAAE